MLFMATHTQKTRLPHDAEQEAAFRQVLSNAGKNGVVMRGMYVNTSTAYFLFEADNTDQIAKVFDPIRDYGHIESAPVVDRLEL